MGFVMQKLALAAVIGLLIAGCNQPPPEQSAPEPASSPAPEQSAPADQPEEATPPTSVADMFSARIDGVLAGDWRSADNKARDPYRHPKQTLEFFGLAPGMTVIEITPGGGWYAQVLAPLLKDDGTYIAAVAKPTNPEGEAAENQSALDKMFAADPEHYGAAKVVVFDAKAPSFGPAGSADMVLTFRNVHNWVSRDTAPAMFQAFFDVLKPGGVLGVTDHRAAAGTVIDKEDRSGYLPQDYVVKLATDAGFTLAAQSEINANPKDTRDYEKGVWTLPPTLTLGDKDREKYVAIGESDRMTLKFVKPQGDAIFRQGNDKTPAAGGNKP
jgi:predicted methyltransferase